MQTRHPHGRRGNRERELVFRPTLGRLDAPILMMHGQKDATVPTTLGRKLRDAVRLGVRSLKVPGGTHSRLHRSAPQLYQQAVKSIIHQLPRSP